jgi:hypothetical protein
LINPEDLTSTDLWQDDVDDKYFLAGIEQFAAMGRREWKDLASPIHALLGPRNFLRLSM